MIKAESTRRGRAVVLEKFGEPLALREFEVPPAVNGATVVACKYGGICGTDLHLHQGHLPIPIPLVLGHEGLGIVHDLDSEAPRDANGAPLAVGDVVMWASSIACGQCVPCRLHREPTLCENRRTYGVNRSTVEEPALSGAWAEYIYLHSGTTIVKLPPGIDHLAAMSLACAGPTMVHALYERRPVRLGETVVVQGSGPVGLAAAALAQMSGAAHVILVGGPAKRLELAAKANVADTRINIIDAADPDEVVSEVLASTDGRGADLVIECTGVPSSLAQGMAMARRGGSYLIIGQYSDAGDTELNPHQIVHRQLDVVGSWAFHGAHVVDYVRLLPALLARFDLQSLVTAYPLDEFEEALEMVAKGNVMKAVLACAGGRS